jgi:hypothetical protein
MARAAYGRQRDRSGRQRTTRRVDDARAAYGRQCGKSRWWRMTRRADNAVRVDGMARAAHGRQRDKSGRRQMRWGHTAMVMLIDDVLLIPSFFLFFSINIGCRF